MVSTLLAVFSFETGYCSSVPPRVVTVTSPTSMLNSSGIVICKVDFSRSGLKFCTEIDKVETALTVVGEADTCTELLEVLTGVLAARVMDDASCTVSMLTPLASAVDNVKPVTGV